MIGAGAMAGPSRPPHRHGRPTCLAFTSLGAVTLLLALAEPLRAQDPAFTATVYVQGFEYPGADRHGTYGEDLPDTLLDKVAAFAGLVVAGGEPTLPARVVGMTSYYGDQPPAYYSAADVSEIETVTAAWGGGVPRYALIIAKYARELMRRSGARQVNFVSASFGSLIVRWLIEKDVGALASRGLIARWANVEGVLAGNWAASRDDLVHYLDFLAPVPVDVEHMHYDWVSSNLHDPRRVADSPNYAGILIGQLGSTDDSYNNGALSSLMRSYEEWQPNDGVQVLADALFENVTARSRLAGRSPTLSLFRTNHFGIKDAPGAWVTLATFLTQRRRVTVTMTSARVADLKEPDDWWWDWRPAEVVFESRVYSPAVESRWGVRDALCTREKEGAVAPLCRYARNGETQAFQHVVFDDLVLDEESELRLVLRAEEIDYDWRYGVLETVQQPYYDDLGSGGLSVSTREPGTYTFAAGLWSCTLSVAVFDYPFAPPLGLPPPRPLLAGTVLRVSPNPHGPDVTVALQGAMFAAGERTATLDVYDLSGRSVRRLAGDAVSGLHWDGRDDAGAALPAGLYLMRLVTPHGAWTARSVLVR